MLHIAFTVFVVEITRENSSDVAVPGVISDSSEKKKLVKADSSEKSGAAKVPLQENGESDSKYSANMDTRDGYRDQEEHIVKASDINSDIKHKHRSGSRGQASPRGQSSPRDKDSRSARGVASPSSASGIQGMSPRNRSTSPNFRNSPRTRNSPRSRSSPGDSDRRHDNLKDHQGHHQNKSSASPNRSSHTSPQRERQPVTVSPVPSPISKSNSKGHGYHDNHNASAMSDIDVISNKAQSDMLNQSDYEEGGDVDSISGEINPPIDDNRIRLFVALFDYDPETMSPNVDSLDEELPFREGQIIKVSLWYLLLWWLCSRIFQSRSSQSCLAG